MSQEELLSRIQELNNKYAEDTITLEELKELHQCAKDLFYQTADDIFDRDPAGRKAHDAQFNEEGNFKCPAAKTAKPNAQ